MSKLFSASCPNDSQREAIETLLFSSPSLYNYHGSLSRRTPFKKNHGDMTLIRGPPGTGKNLQLFPSSPHLCCLHLSALIREQTTFLSMKRHLRIKIPSIRVLVCSASNTADDELMLRVVHDGLSAPCGSKACPKLRRVGHGTSNEQL